MSVALRTITRLQDADDINVSLGVGVDEYALVYDHDTAKFVLRAMSAGVTDHGALTGLADDDHTQYLLATGTRTGASSQAQAFTVGVITGAIKPASDSTTALQVQQAGGTAILTVDTTNGYLGINTTPSYRLHVSNPAGGSPFGLVIDGGGPSRPQLRLRADDTSYRFDGQMSSDGMEFTSYKDAPSAGFQNITFNGQIVVFNAADYNRFSIATAEQGRWTSTGLVIAGKAYNPASRLHVHEEDAATNAASQLLTLSHNTSGTVAAGFGSRVLWELESSTTADQAAAALDVAWATATHASRAGRALLYAYDTAARECLRVEASGSAPMIGFLGASAAVRRSHVADPSGGSTVDAEARSAINSILATLEIFGFHATS